MCYNYTWTPIPQASEGCSLQLNKLLLNKPLLSRLALGLASLATDQRGQFIYPAKERRQKMIVSGIYKITCLVTDKVYVGSSTNIHIRWMNHRKQLRRGTHRNNYLLRAWQKYGEESFEFTVLEEVEPDQLSKREHYWIARLRSCEHDHGYNITVVNQDGLSRHSTESRQKISAANKGRPLTQEQYQRFVESQRRRVRTEKDMQHTLEMSRRNIGRPLSESHRLSIQESATHIALRGSYIVTSPDGQVYNVIGISLFCREHNLCASHLVKVARGKKRQYKGWLCRYA